MSFQVVGVQWNFSCKCFQQSLSACLLSSSMVPASEALTTLMDDSMLQFQNLQHCGRFGKP
jgi:hypothetical protein